MNSISGQVPGSALSQITTSEASPSITPLSFALLQHHLAITMSSGITNQHYRESTALGSSLMETLDGLVQAKKITPEVAIKILENFDVAVAKVLSTEVETTFKAKARLLQYNHVDDVLNMKVSGKLTLQYDKYHSKELDLRKMQIVAMRDENAQTASQRPGE